MGYSNDLSETTFHPCPLETEHQLLLALYQLRIKPLIEKTHLQSGSTKENPGRHRFLEHSAYLFFLQALVVLRSGDPHGSLRKLVVLAIFPQGDQ